MRILAALITCLIVSLAFCPARAQTRVDFDRESLNVAGALLAEQQAMLLSRRRSIHDEASSLPANEWAGTYTYENSPTSGAQLDWAPANGFLVWWNTCSHEWRDVVNFGSVDFRDGLLHVTPELGGDGKKVYALAGELIPVRWGEQHYLIPVDQLIAFCYAARNAGRSLEIKEFFLKEADRDKRRFGLPAVPSQYKKYLGGPPIQATIIDVKSLSLSDRFTLNVGRTAGVVSGMKFFVLTPRNVYMLVEVLEVRDASAEAYAITSGFKNRSGKRVQARIGWKLTSRAPKRAYEYFPG